jgi:hypothetical protein
MSEPLPTPKNTAIEVVKIILEKLIEGLGADAAIAAATAYAPWLAYPFVKQIFGWVVGQVAQVIDENLFKLSIKLIIRVQSTERKAEFNAAIVPIVGGSPTDEEIQRARDAADRVIERNR